MQEYVKKSPTTDCSSRVYECGQGPSGASYATNLALDPLTCLEVWCRVQTPVMQLWSVTPFTEGATVGTWRGETAAPGRHEGDPMVGWA